MTKPFDKRGINLTVGNSRFRTGCLIIICAPGVAVFICWVLGIVVKWFTIGH